MADLQSARVLILARGLMFVSRITATGRAAGVVTQTIRDPAKLGDSPGRLLIVDLNLEGAIEAASEWKKGGSPAMGFVAHVDTQTINRAKTAGIDPVVTRGQFVRMLPTLFPAENRPAEPQDVNNDDAKARRIS